MPENRVMDPGSIWRRRLPVAAIFLAGIAALAPGTQEVFIAAGHGIRPAGEIPALPDVDVAPTLAHVLHVRLDSVQGKLLAGVLEPGD